MEFLKSELEEIKKQNLYRRLIHSRPLDATKFILNGREVINAASNNYLGLTHDRRVIEFVLSCVKEYGTGSGASRLVVGSFDLHQKLEREIADLKRCDGSIVFPTGYQANVGTISALVGKGDVIFSDRLNHASIIDGCRLSKAEIVVYEHRDLSDLESKLKIRRKFRRALIITDTVFSVDGDVAPVRELKKIAEDYDAIFMVDEAHATGVFGERGGGVTEEQNVEVDVNMGTLSKALASQGGYVAGSELLKDYLVNKARAFIYSTALSPANVAAAIAAIKVVKEDRKIREKLWRNVKLLRKGLKDLNFEILSEESQITPVLIGDEKVGVEFSKELLKNGVFCPILRYPTVPKGMSRVRVSVTAAHTREQIDKILDAFEKARRVI